LAEPRSTARTVYLACFFFSGAAGLIYQILWIRILSIVFGNTIYAASMVVAAFLAGLAIGSHVWGKRADGIEKPLKAYIQLEVGIAVTSLAATVLIFLLDDAIVGMMSVESIASGRWQLLRFVMLFCLLIVPTFLMGGTTPIMAKFFVKNFERLGRGIASLYAANTYGAMAGCFLSGFFLIHSLGIKGALLSAVFLNLMVAGVLWAVGDHLDEGVETAVKPKSTPKKQKKKKPAPVATDNPRRTISLPFALMLIAVAGFSSLVYEILWTRAFLVNFKGTVYLFSNLLTVFLLGIALGSQLVGRKLDRMRNPLAVFGLAQVGIGLFGVLSVLIFLHLGDFAVSLGGMMGEMDWQKNVLVMFFLMLFVFLLPTVLMGFSYPVICRLITESLGVLGRKVGVVYAVGTAGGILGSLAAGFLLIPVIGLQNGLFLVSAIVMVNGFTALLKSGARRISGFVLPVSAVIALVAFIGFAITGVNIGIGTVGEGKLVYENEGAMGTVKVSQRWKNGPYTLMVNDYQLATSGDVAVRFGHVPLILKPNAEDVLVISLGSGITSGAVGAHPVKNIECVEIVPALFDIQPLFAKDNHNIIADRRFHLTFWDGRHYVKVTKKKYDLVISDLFQPDSAGVGLLYSLEHFNNVKAKLKKGGAMAQWLPLYQLSPFNLKVIMRTFAEAFPNVAVWSGDLNSEMPTLLLFGSVEPLRINPATLLNSLKMGSVKRDMIEYNDPFSFLSFYITDRDGIMKFVDDAPINTDNLPIVEYTAPRYIWGRRKNTVENFVSLIKLRKKASSLLQGSDDPKIIREMDKYFRGRTEILKAKAEHAVRDYNRELEFYQKAAKFVPHDPFLAMSIFDLGYMYYRRTDYVMSSKLLDWARQINPDLLEAYFYLAKSYEKEGKKQEAFDVLKALASKRPDIAEKLLKK